MQRDSRRKRCKAWTDRLLRVQLFTSVTQRKLEHRFSTKSGIWKDTLRCHTWNSFFFLLRGGGGGWILLRSTKSTNYTHWQEERGREKFQFFLLQKKLSTFDNVSASRATSVHARPKHRGRQRAHAGGQAFERDTLPFPSGQWLQ